MANEYLIEMDQAQLLEVIEYPKAAAPFFIPDVVKELGEEVYVRLKYSQTDDSIGFVGEVVWRRRGSKQLGAGIGVSIAESLHPELAEWVNYIIAGTRSYSTSLELKLIQHDSIEPVIRVDDPYPTIEELEPRGPVKVAESMAMRSRREPDPVVIIGGPEEKINLDPSIFRTMQATRSPREGEFVAAKFQCIKEIGRGGVSVIYRARNSALGKHVALKMMQEDLLDREDVRELFANEARILSALDTTYIPAIFDFGVDTHFGPYFVMEHLQGGTLAKQLEDQTEGIEARRFFELAIKLTVAIGSLHMRQIIHCDLKPDNIWVGREEELTGTRITMKIFDFGISRRGGTPGDRELQRETGAGTPCYMAPEQVVGDRLDARTDLYALGTIFYRMLAGSVPFVYINPYQTLRAHLDEKPPAITTRRRQPVDPALERLVMRMLAKRPGDRFPNAGEIHERLLELQRTHNKGNDAGSW